MTNKIFYVLNDSKTLKNDGTFSSSYTNVKTFTSEQDAINYIDANLAAGEYLILQKVVKS